ncbi:MAG: polysaccharide export protein [Deltaproteobacteria bacterium]|nr:polysaccharide export protein [Deltaproteobacteria bacterium]
MSFKRTLRFAISLSVITVFAVAIPAYQAISEDITPGKIQQGQEYRFGPGDVLSIEVFEAGELSKTVMVNSRGFITFPLLGSVKVKGLTERELEQKLEGLLGEKYLQAPNVTVFIKEGGYFYVVGEVKEGGRFPYRPGLTLQQAVAMAGGISDVGKASMVQIKRVDEDGGVEIITVNHNELRAGKAVDPMLRKDDIIYVPQSYFWSLARAFFFSIGVGDRHSVGVNPTTVIER